MSNISEAIRQQVRERAGDQCEYCLSHQTYTMGWLQIDHILPVAQGGSDDEDNLCLACELCNQYKWAKTHTVDPETAQNVALFNPRQQRWSEHFTWSSDGAEIVGLTSCGRVTVIALNLNNQLAVTYSSTQLDRGWLASS
jgi:hypothetical protein